MRKYYDLVIFDLDGTLLDTSEGIIAAVEYTVRECNYPSLTKEAIKAFIGPPIQNSFEKTYQISKEEAGRLAVVFRNRYKDHELLRADYYPNIASTLQKIKQEGYVLAVATYKREDYALRILDKFGLLNMFDISHGSDMEGKKTKKDIIKQCIDESGKTDISKIVYIGDTEGDRKSAEEIGIDFIGVTYGFGFKKGDKMYNSISLVDTPTELISIL